MGVHVKTTSQTTNATRWQINVTSARLLVSFLPRSYLVTPNVWWPLEISIPATVSQSLQHSISVSWSLATTCAYQLDQPQAAVINRMGKNVKSVAVDCTASLLTDWWSEHLWRPQRSVLGCYSQLTLAPTTDCPEFTSGNFCDANLRNKRCLSTSPVVCTTSTKPVVGRWETDPFGMTRPFPILSPQKTIEIVRHTFILPLPHCWVWLLCWLFRLQFHGERQITQTLNRCSTIEGTVHF